MKTAPLFAGMGGHHSARSRTDEWLTPPGIIEALGGADSFDLDPCAPADQPYRTARETFTKSNSGLLKPWHGRVWLNPPYTVGPLTRFLARMAEHGRGAAFIFARTETDAFFRYVWERADAMLFLRGRVNFHLPSGKRAEANSGAPSVLCAYGAGEAEILAFCGLDGQFIALRLPRGVIVQAIDSTWAEAVGGWMRAQHGPVRLDDCYRAFAGHPKVRRNPNWRAKIRQTLQAGPFQRIDRGIWKVAS